MKKIALFLLVLTAVLLCACQSSSPESVAASYYHVGDLLDCVNWPGQTPEQVSIPSKYVKENDALSCILIDGTLFGVNAFGNVLLTDRTQSQIRAVHIQCKALSYGQCRQELVARYGEPEDEGVEPYVASNGGAVTWCSFLSETCRITLQKASEYTAVELELTLAS